MFDNVIIFVFILNTGILIILILSSCWKWTPKWQWFIGVPAAITGMAFPLVSYLTQGDAPLSVFFAGAFTFFFWMFFASVHAALGTNVTELPDYTEYQKWRIVGDEKPERKKAMRFGYLSMASMALMIVSGFLE